jgi:hypothetical protein
MFECVKHIAEFNIMENDTGINENQLLILSLNVSDEFESNFYALNYINIKKLKFQVW